MSGRIDAATLLERALIGDAMRASVVVTVNAATTTRWASATFVGARHRLTLAGDWCPAVAEWLEGLPEADLPLRRHLVAELVVTEQAREGGAFSAMIEVLTVEEA